MISLNGLLLCHLIIFTFSSVLIFCFAWIKSFIFVSSWRRRLRANSGSLFFGSRYSCFLIRIVWWTLICYVSVNGFFVVVKQQESFEPLSQRLLLHPYSPFSYLLMLFCTGMKCHAYIILTLAFLLSYGITLIFTIYHLQISEVHKWLALLSK